MSPMKPNLPIERSPIEFQNREFSFVILDPLSEGTNAARSLTRYPFFESLLYHLFYTMFHDYRNSSVLEKLFHAAMVNGSLNKAMPT